ncbi:MAG: xanthine dehydrogenase family protein molybdopterin-binding subunit [Sandaracinaceae bacterium]
MRASPPPIAAPPTLRKLGRRELLMLGGAGLAAVGLGVAAYRRLARPRVGDPVARDGMLSPSAFVAMDGDGIATVWVPKSEMGQGVRTGLAMVVAEGLDLPFDRVRVEQAPVDPRFGEMATVASASVRTTFEPLRAAGALLRRALVEAAAEVWGVDPDALDTELGEVIAPGTSRRASYASLVAAASGRPFPNAAPPRRGPWRVIGTSPPRVDVPDKVRGVARYGLDVRLPGMRFAVIARPAPGARIVRVDERAARAVPGVEAVLPLNEIGSWAVVARSTWAALRGREALAATSSRGEHAGLDDAAIGAALRAAAAREEHVAEDVGRRVAGREGDGSIELVFSFPYLAHAAMEPLSCTIDVDRARGRAEVWVPTQHPVLHRDEVARLLGLAAEDVTLHVTYLGGGFGRRAEGDEVREAAILGRRIGTVIEGPVQLVWSREDDLRHDTFRDAAVVIARGSVTSDGDVRALRFAVGTPSADPSVLASFMVEGLVDHGYAIPSRRVAWSGVRLPVRTGIWRSVAHSYTAFAKEHALDVLVRRAGADPIEARRRLVSDAPRLRGVLDRAVARAMRSPLEADAARGVALHACFGSFAAHVADVAVRDGRVLVRRVVVAADCGLVVSPDLVRQQLEGGVIFGLSAALHGRVSIRDGAPTASSFADYPILRIGEAPVIEVELVQSDAAPSGVGELGVPGVAPAVANALLALGLPPQAGLPLRAG